MSCFPGFHNLPSEWSDWPPEKGGSCIKIKRCLNSNCDYSKRTGQHSFRSEGKSNYTTDRFGRTSYMERVYCTACHHSFDRPMSEPYDRGN
jgi:hypothetical protein